MPTFSDKYAIPKFNGFIINEYYRHSVQNIRFLKIKLSMHFVHLRGNSIGRISSQSSLYELDDAMIRNP